MKINMPLFNFKRRQTKYDPVKHCNHTWRIREYSNVLQLDDMGYPLRLVICQCTKCGSTEQQWRDVNKSALEELDTGKSVLLKWQKI